MNTFKVLLLYLFEMMYLMLVHLLELLYQMYLDQPNRKDFFSKKSLTKNLLEKVHKIYFLYLIIVRQYLLVKVVLIELYLLTMV